MTSSLSNVIGLIIFSLLIASLILETILSIFWNKLYFTAGLPVLVLRIPVESPYTDIPNKSRFEAKFHSAWAKSLVFKQFDSNIYGFREEFFSFHLMRSSAMMHGLVLFDHENNQVVVKGFANWFMAWVALLCMGAPLLSGKPWMALVSVFTFLFFVGMLYLIQYYRFSQVASFAAQEWTRKHARELADV